MARMNRTVTATLPRTHEGAPAKRIDAEAQLRRSVMACLLWEDTFYEGGQSIADRIEGGVQYVGAETAAEIAIEAREQMNLRHAPLWIIRAMARHYGGTITGDTLARVIQRADELSEFLALYWKDGKQPLSNQVKRGLAAAFAKFDAYQLAKYDRDTEIRLRDVLFLCHAKPRDEEQAALWQRLIDGTLESPDTWEVALSGGGDKREHWTRLLDEKKLGGLALLRNLRNMKQAGVDEQRVRQAIAEHPFPRVLPFRFIAAAQFAPEHEDVLEQAMYRALEGQRLPGKTALVLDNSGSMYGYLSGRGSMMRADAAGGLAILIREICDQAVIVGFGSSAAILPNRRGFALADAYRRGPGGGTNTNTAKLLADREGYDRIIILTDEQSHQRLSDPLTDKAYVVNVAAYQNGIGYGKWTHIDGWSEAIVRYITESEAGA